MSLESPMPVSAISMARVWMATAGLRFDERGVLQQRFTALPNLAASVVTTPAEEWRDVPGQEVHDTLPAEAPLYDTITRLTDELRNAHLALADAEDATDKAEDRARVAESHAEALTAEVRNLRRADREGGAVAPLQGLVRALAKRAGREIEPGDTPIVLCAQANDIAYLLYPMPDAEGMERACMAYLEAQRFGRNLEQSIRLAVVSAHSRGGR